MSEDLYRATSRRLAHSLQPAMASLQAVILVCSAIEDIDTSALFGRSVLCSLAAVHLVGAVWMWRTVGLFERGPFWVGLWLSMLVVIPLVEAHLVRSASYAGYIAGVPLFAYPAGLLAVLACYPWTRHRLLLDTAVLAVVALEPLLIVLQLHSGHPTGTNLFSVTASFVWSLLAYLVGRVIARIFRGAVTGQLETQQEDYREFFDFLHSHVDTVIAAVRRRVGPDVPEIQQLRHTVCDRRLAMLLLRDAVPLAEVFKENLRFFDTALTVTAFPRVGLLTVRRPVGVLLSRALGDLLKNAIQHADGTAEVDFSTHQGSAVLEVGDRGPGLSPAVFEDASTSLYALRRAARDLGGDLVAVPGRQGAHLRLSVPLYGTVAERSA